MLAFGLKEMKETRWDQTGPSLEHSWTKHPLKKIQITNFAFDGFFMSINVLQDLGLKCSAWEVFGNK